MTASSALRNIAIFGAGGHNIGHHILLALLANPAFKVTVIARASSSTAFPPEAHVLRIPDTPSHSDLVTAFKDQDVILSAVGYPAKLTEPQLIDAAIEAGVKRFIPSEYGLNNDLPAARALNPVFEAKGKVIDYLRSKESTGLTWTSVATGMWLDWSLDPNIAFLGMNPKTKSATLYDQGQHTLSFTTLPWAALAIVKMLELDPQKTANRVFPVRAFETSQKQIVAELEKQQGVTWKNEELDVASHIKEQKEKLAGGDKNAIYALIAVGFLTKGYGSDLVGEGIVPVGSDELEGLPEITLVSVVKEALGRLEKGERTY